MSRFLFFFFCEKQHGTLQKKNLKMYLCEQSAAGARSEPPLLHLWWRGW